MEKKKNRKTVSVGMNLEETVQKYKTSFVTQKEFDALKARVEKIEKKMSVVSGK